ncbi:sugar transferase [Bordetella pertussis]|nr:sugar transferase [Bordetella pertussis]
MIKRLFDVVCSGLGLLALLPLLALIAIAIKLDSPGPVFFRQERVGKDGVPFRIHKLRSMSVRQDPQAGQITVGADPRITRVGKWIRKWKLDELVQLIDVFTGSMSLVGPRPKCPAMWSCIRTRCATWSFRCAPESPIPRRYAFATKTRSWDNQATPNVHTAKSFFRKNCVSRPNMSKHGHFWVT